MGRDDAKRELYTPAFHSASRHATCFVRTKKKSRIGATKSSSIAVVGLQQLAIGQAATLVCG